MEEYDVVVVGSGLGGLAGANFLAKQGHSVLLLEQNHQFGGLAAWFKRKGGHIFDVSLHGFPFGMVKSCRKYWGKEVAEWIVQLKDIRFINPQFQLTTTFDREDFTKKLTTEFHVPEETVQAFFTHVANMNFYDNDRRTTRELFEEFFPGRNDIQRLLMEPITYANGSTLDDPAITYGIVFSNFMNKGVYTFCGGTDHLIGKFVEELQKNGVEVRKRCLVEKIVVDPKTKRVIGVQANGSLIRCKAVLSNANLKATIEHLVGSDALDGKFLEEAKAVRLNSSSCQVYMGIKEGETIPDIGDLIFISDAKSFSSEELKDFHTTSRTFSFYYPKTRPQSKNPHYTVVASINAQWNDWANLSDADYAHHKARICEESITCLERLIPNIREKLDWVEAATPKTFNRYTLHPQGTSFGTKFEGLQVSMDLPNHVPGLYHTGSVGIIMSGWLGAMNYGVIAAHKLDAYITAR